MKRKATRLPDTILRAARADRLRRESDRVEVSGNRVTLVTERSGESWPRMITLTDEQGTGQIGLSRLSGHAFYEVAWEGGLHVRRFELSNTSRRGVPFEHIELAMLLAEALGTEYDLEPEPVTAAEVEAAYLRRMKADGAELGPPDATMTLPATVEGQAAATHKVGGMTATMLVGDDDFAYVTATDRAEQAILLSRNEQRGAMLAVPVRRGRPQRNSPLMTTPLAELEASPPWHCAVCAWGAWLLWTQL